MVAASVLPTMAQEWQSTSVFQSTSTMTGSGSAYSSNPTINANGTAVAPTGGPHKAKKEDAGSLWGGQTVGEKVSDPTQPGSPLGDAILPLMLCAGAYLIIRARRRMVRSKVSEKGMEK